MDYKTLKMKRRLSRIALWLLMVAICVIFLTEVIVMPCIAFYQLQGVFGIFHWLGILLGGLIGICLLVIILAWLAANAE